MPKFLLSLFGASLFLCAPVARAETGDASVGRWTSPGNGPSHSGFYPVTVGDTSAVPGWTKYFGPQPVNPVAVSDGRVIVTANAYGEPFFGRVSTPFTAALSTVDGQELWRHDTRFFDPPVVNEHHIFLHSSDELHVLNIGDGALEWERTLSGNDTFDPPLVFGDRVWVNNSQGVSSFRISDNSERFFSRLSYPGYGCRVSYYRGVLYVTDPKTFRAIDAETGVRLWSVPMSQNSREAVPAVMDDKAAVVTGTHELQIVDLETKWLLWSVFEYNLTGRPATDGATVYAFVGAGVNAYAAESGQLRGRYEVPSGGGPGPGESIPWVSQPLITNDLVMIGTSKATYIFDKATYQLRTQLPVGGYLTYANGVLYVSDYYGTLATFRFPGATPEPPPNPWPSPTPVPAPLASGPVEMVSVNNQGTAAANFVSGLIGLSAANGRFILFASSATDVTDVPDNNQQADLFLRDRQTGTTQMVSINYAGTGASGPDGVSGPREAQLTPDGRFVVFKSLRTDLVPEPNSTNSVFIRDMQGGTTNVVSRDLNGAPRPASQPFVSADGCFVAFTSSAQNLVPNQATGPASDVYVRDLLTNTTSLVSVDSGDRGVGEAGTIYLTRNGRFVLYWTAKSGTQNRQLYLRDVQTGTSAKITVSILHGGDPTNGAFEPLTARVNEDGRFVVFQSSSPDLAPNDSNPHTDIFIRDVAAGTTERIASEPYTENTLCDISADGQVVAFLRQDLTVNYTSDEIDIYDRRRRTVEQLTTAVPFSRTAAGVSMDASGRFVAFESASSSAIGFNEDTNGKTDIYLVDRQLHTTRLISHDLNGSGAGNSDSRMRSATNGVISDDGQTVVFESGATNLSSTPLPQPPPSFVFNVFASSVPATGQLLNISTRTEVLEGDKALIAGFVVTGAGAKKIMIRATGPSLASVGLNGLLGDPVLELYNHGGALIANNDNWRAEEAQVTPTGIAPVHELEPALVRTVEPGAYTALVRGKGGSTGLAVVELYDLAQNGGSRLANISTRGFVRNGDKVMIAGFIAGSEGGGGSRVLVRALGPTLAALGVPEALPNPALELRDGNGALVTQNDNWKDTQRFPIEATGIPPTNDAESAILCTLGPGPYTAIVSGNGGTGVGLVEVYKLP